MWPELYVKQISRRRWEVVADFEWRGVNVPAGFITDAGSIPRFVWWWTRPEGVFPAALIHDWRYARCGEEGAATKREADEEFRVNVRALGFRRTKSRACWLGPRMFGWIPWNRYMRRKKYCTNSPLKISGVSGILCLLLLGGCLTPQGRAVREVGNIWLSTKMERYCANKDKAERDVIARAVNDKLHFNGQVRIVCEGETSSLVPEAHVPLAPSLYE